MKVHKRQIATWCLLVCLVAGTSCIGFRGPEDLRRDLVQATGVELDREVGVSIGRVGVMLVRWFTPEREIPLKGVRGIQVGVYEVIDHDDSTSAHGPFEPPVLAGWEPVVRVHEEGESVFVMLYEKQDDIRGMLVVVMDEDEWVLVRVRGKLRRIVEQAMRMAFEQAERPELFEPAVTDYRKSRSADPADPVDEAAG
jgi:hypothetical protein